MRCDSRAIVAAGQWEKNELFGGVGATLGYHAYAGEIADAPDSVLVGVFGTTKESVLALALNLEFGFNQFRASATWVSPLSDEMLGAKKPRVYFSGTVLTDFLRIPL